MRAWIIGSPSGPSGLVSTTVAAPRVGPHDVLVQMRAVSLNHRDLLALRGGYGLSQLSGGIPCSDSAGTVIDAGARVTRCRVGDRVVSTFAPRWTTGTYSTAFARTQADGSSPDGVLAECWALHEDGVVAVPPAMTFEQASTLPCAALTAWHALFEEERLPDGANVLVQGTGGVAIFALQFAKWAGARVVATTSHAGKVAILRQLGADEVIHGETADDVARAVMRVTHGLGVDHVIEVGGQGTLSESLRVVRDGGTISLVGGLARPAAVVLSPVFLRNIRIQGVSVGSRAMFERMLDAYGQGVAAPVIDRVFAFDDAPRAFSHLEDRRHVGKVVVGLVPSPPG